MSLSPRDREQLLDYVHIFSGLKKRDIRSLAKACDERHFAAGQTLCRKGEQGVALFIIAHGEVRVEDQLDDGRRVPIGQLGPGSVVGEMAILDGAERLAWVTAVSPVEALVLTSWDFMGVMRKRPEVALDLLPEVVRRFRQLAAEVRRVAQQQPVDDEPAIPLVAAAAADVASGIPSTKRMNE